MSTPTFRYRPRRFEDAFELFWDESCGGYVDHAIVGERQLPMSQRAGPTAVWAQLVPDGRALDLITDRSRLVRAIWMQTTGPQYLNVGHGEATWDFENQIVAAQPFYRYVLHDALASAGCASQIASLCRDWVELLE